MTLRERFEELVVGDRCPSDPCASENGLKMRAFAVVAVPAALLVLGTWPLPPESTIAQAAVVLAVTWVAVSVVLVGRWINGLEPCDDVEQHYGEEGSA